MAETIISKGITIDGEISGTEPVIIEGKVKGLITVEAPVKVAEIGQVEADVTTTEIHVSGTVTGNIVAKDRVELAASSRMMGDVRAPRILIADGAGFKGHIDMDIE